MSSPSQTLAGSHRHSKPCKKGSNGLSITDYSFQPGNSVKPAHQVCDGPTVVPFPRPHEKGTILAMPFNQTFIQDCSLPQDSIYSGFFPTSQELSPTYHPLTNNTGATSHNI